MSRQQSFYSQKDDTQFLRVSLGYHLVWRQP
jgi:hypothetical protein